MPMLETGAHGAVIGAGIAGLAVGLYAQKKGVLVDLLEKDGGLACEDNLLWIAPNGLHMLADMGLIGAVLARSVRQTSMLFSTRGLKELTALDCEKLAASNGYPIVAIKRGDLYRLLLERYLEQGGEVHYGQTLVALRQEADRVQLTFQGLAQPRAYDFAIGADGIGSTVRRLLFPQSEVTYQGIRTYLGRSVTPVSARYVGRTIEIWGVGTRFMLTSLDGESTYWSAIERQPFYQKNSAAIEPDRLARLQQAFADYHADVGAILAAAEPASLHRCNFGVVNGLGKYHQGRVCLVGDAAHGMPPNMGQGASLALEDACCVISALSHTPSIEVALTAYGRQRRPRAKQMVQIANSMNTTFQPKGRWASSLRDVAAAAFPQGLSQRRMAPFIQSTVCAYRGLKAWDTWRSWPGGCSGGCA